MTLPALLEHIKGGLPFKASSEANENVPDDEAHYRGEVTEKVKADSKAIADSGTWPRFVSLRVSSGSGALQIKRKSASRTAPVEKIVTKPVVRASGALWVAPSKDTAEDGASELSEVEEEEEEVEQAARVVDSEEAAEVPASVPAPVAFEPAPAEEEDAEMADGDVSIALRIKKGRRKAAQVSYAEEDEDSESSESSEESSPDSESEEEIDDQEAPLLVVRYNNVAMPTVMTREERDNLLDSVSLWYLHLKRLKSTEEEVQSIVSTAFSSNDLVHSLGNSSHAENSLDKLLHSLANVVQLLRNAKPAKQSHTAIEELQELDAELVDAGMTVQYIDGLQAMIARRSQGAKLYKYERRSAFRRGLRAVKVRGLGRSKREQAAKRETMPALLDEVSQGQIFVSSFSY